MRILSNVSDFPTEILPILTPEEFFILLDSSPKDASGA